MSGFRQPVYLIGEKGPEVFVPNQDGHIIPNHKLPGVLKKAVGKNKKKLIRRAEGGNVDVFKPTVPSPVSVAPTPTPRPYQQEAEAAVAAGPQGVAAYHARTNQMYQEATAGNPQADRNYQPAPTPAAVAPAPSSFRESPPVVPEYSASRSAEGGFRTPVSGKGWEMDNAGNPFGRRKGMGWGFSDSDVPQSRRSSGFDPLPIENVIDSGTGANRYLKGPGGQIIDTGYVGYGGRTSTFPEIPGGYTPKDAHLYDRVDPGLNRGWKTPANPGGLPPDMRETTEITGTQDPNTPGGLVRSNYVDYNQLPTQGRPETYHDPFGAYSKHMWNKRAGQITDYRSKNWLREAHPDVVPRAKGGPVFGFRAPGPGLLLPATGRENLPGRARGGNVESAAAIEAASRERIAETQAAAHVEAAKAPFVQAPAQGFGNTGGQKGQEARLAGIPGNDASLGSPESYGGGFRAPQRELRESELSTGAGGYDPSKPSFSNPVVVDYGGRTVYQGPGPAQFGSQERANQAFIRAGQGTPREGSIAGYDPVGGPGFRAAGEQERLNIAARGEVAKDINAAELKRPNVVQVARDLQRKNEIADEKRATDDFALFYEGQFGPPPKVGTPAFDDYHDALVHARKNGGKAGVDRYVETHRMRQLEPLFTPENLEALRGVSGHQNNPDLSPAAWNFVQQNPQAKREYILKYGPMLQQLRPPSPAPVGFQWIGAGYKETPGVAGP